jgi:hypothetical protein
LGKQSLYDVQRNLWTFPKMEPERCTNQDAQVEEIQKWRHFYSARRTSRAFRVVYHVSCPILLFILQLTNERYIFVKMDRKYSRDRTLVLAFPDYLLTIYEKKNGWNWHEKYIIPFIEFRNRPSLSWHKTNTLPRMIWAMGRLFLT